ncbi:hypothetical protein PTSG_03805 [Salpingoeca rosetta]|uniref:Trichome birefringence-like C-terminal domain-containing protein n=1 Tax=Salpingoeca rosetta (strain ATCC 50818 / BSB-021) TaxID=946362 RepID=F2U5F8_SALR5|nr:uncharacterized protein PTSG_03805 [Salpingoeca rosetta]EGD83174.1 hypothetical protein PTSG_03805 [Salpingoeca rosetta]|eukprot:XP_004995538.1 hypothetical protein PTSG_03805 [Salpingoeca rosetta]
MMTMVKEGSVRLTTWVLGLCLLASVGYILSSECAAVDGDSVAAAAAAAGGTLNQEQRRGAAGEGVLLSSDAKQDSVLSQLFLDLQSQAKSYRTELAASSKQIDSLQQENAHLREELAAVKQHLTAVKNAVQVTDPSDKQAAASDTPTTPPPTAAPPVGQLTFHAHWEEVPEEDWDSLLRRRGCKEVDYIDKVHCCNPKYFHNFTTPMKHMRFVSPYPFAAYKLERLIRGGTISFIGDSITSQIYEALRARAHREKYVTRPLEKLPPLAQAGLQYINNKTGHPALAFTTLLYRADKAENIDEFIEASIPQLPSTAQHSSNRPQHIIVANIGLHFSDTHKDKSEEFRVQVDKFARALSTFNKHPLHFGFFRDITPQHFQSRADSSKHQGDYFKRDRSINHCAPWQETQLQSHRNNLNNEYLIETAARYGLVVQPTTEFLAPRFDAHLETRNNDKGNVLDCTHWCAPVFDVFEDGLMAVLASRFSVDWLHP